jgi:hypothetical protein
LTSATPLAQTTIPRIEIVSNRSPKSKKHVSEESGHRHQIEQTSEPGRRGTANEPVHQSDGCDRQDQHQPSQRENQLTVQCISRASQTLPSDSHNPQATPGAVAAGQSWRAPCSAHGTAQRSAPMQLDLLIVWAAILGGLTFLALAAD